MRIVIFALLLASTPAVADDWPAAHPRSWHARGFSRVVEVFPAKSRCNPTDKPLAYVYEMGYPPLRWDVDPKLVWKGPLVNREAPYEAIVSSDGYVVTFDDWGNIGFDNAVVIYDPRGKLVKSKKLDDLVPEDVRNRDRSVSSRYWRKGARYVFDDKRKLVQVHLANAGVLELSLVDGKHTYSATPGKAPADSNAQVEIWETSLRFSSISDVIAAKTAQATKGECVRVGSAGGELGGYPGQKDSAPQPPPATKKPKKPNPY